MATDSNNTSADAPQKWDRCYLTTTLQAGCLAGRGVSRLWLAAGRIVALCLAVHCWLADVDLVGTAGSAGLCPPCSARIASGCASCRL